jgi:hypothetical protein
MKCPELKTLRLLETVPKAAIAELLLSLLELLDGWSVLLPLPLLALVVDCPPSFK